MAEPNAVVSPAGVRDHRSVTPDPINPAESATGPGVLRDSRFRRLWSANVAAGLGEQFAVIALSVTAVLVLHASTFQLAVIVALGNSAALLLGIPAGVWVDRWPSRRVLVVADLVRALVLLSVPVAFHLSRLTIGQLMVAAALISACGVFFETAHSTILPALVGRDRVAVATARLQTSDAGLRVIGPGIAGQLLRITTGPALYLGTAATALISAVLIARIDVRQPVVAKSAREPFWPAVLTGLGFIWQNPALRTLTLVSAGINAGSGIYVAILPTFVLRTLHLSPASYGLALGVGSGGGILGSILAVPLARAVGEVRTIVLNACVIPLAFLILPLATLAPGGGFVLVASSDFMFGVLIVAFAINAGGIRARVTPTALLGRVVSGGRVVSQGSIPVGSLIGGAVAARYGVVAGLALALVVALLAVLAILGSPLRNRRALPDDWNAHGDRSAFTEPPEGER